MVGGIYSLTWQCKLAMSETMNGKPFAIVFQLLIVSYLSGFVFECSTSRSTSGKEEDEVRSFSFTLLISLFDSPEMFLWMVLMIRNVQLNRCTLYTDM